MWLARRNLAIALAMGLALGAPSAALAARSVPHGFFGMNWDQEVAYRSSSITRAEQWGRMAAAGVESVRTPFLWTNAQPTSARSTDFSWTDEVVTLAAQHGVELLPVVTWAPEWARKYPHQPLSPPARDGAYTSYLRELVERYGPKGTFWTKHPRVPRRPVRSLQIWNEPAEHYQWSVPRGEDWAPAYGKLLRDSYRAIKAIDPSVRVVMAGLANTSPQYLEHLYDVGGIRGHFDIAAIHPYTADAPDVLARTEQFRAVMAAHGDRAKKLWATEMGLPASEGKLPDTIRLQTSDAGMARFLTTSYDELLQNRTKLNIDHVFFYTWASVYKGWIFKWSGLYEYNRVGGRDVFQEKPALTAYRKLTRSGEGCSKDPVGRCAR